MGTPAFPFVNYVYPSTAANTTSMSNIAWTKQKVTGTLGETAYFALDNTINNQLFTQDLSFNVAKLEFNYDLQIIENNSTVSQNSALSTNENASNSKIQIYPSPVKNSLTISGLKEGENFEIFTNDGRKIKSGRYLPNSILDVSKFAKGFYNLKIAGKNFKFIKE
jgi:hypothetical protein